MEMNVEPVISIPMADNNSLSALGARSVLARREPMYVIDLSVQIQRGFRIKMLTILLLQLILTMAISISLRAITSEGPEPTWLAIAFPPKSLQTLALGLVCIGSLPMMTYVRDIHPWNIVVTVIWTLGWAVFLAVAQLPGALILSNTFFVVFGACTLGVAVLLILSTLTTTDQETGDKRLWSFKSAGTIAGIVMLAGSFAFYSQTTHFYEPGGAAHFIMANLIAVCLFAWVVYDSGRLCERMQPDDYMKGVIYFYTDFLMVCCCCLFAGCMGSAAS